MFDDSPRLGRQALSHLINRLAGRLGNENVVYPTLQSGAQPEYSYRLKPLVDANRKRRRRVASAKDSSHRLARPIRLCRPMLVQATFEEEGETATGVRDLHRPPVAIEIAGRVYQVVDCLLYTSPSPRDS